MDTFLGQSLRDSQTDADAAARDNGYFIFQL
jgi:hypothetical protein